MPRFFTLLALVVVMSIAPVASADVAQTQFVEAKKEYDENNYGEALQMFQLAWESSHSPVARLYIGRCFSRLGNFKAAYNELQGTISDSEAKSAEDEKYLKTRDAAAAEIVIIEREIGRVIITLEGGAKGAKVKLNDREVPAFSIGQPIALAPGDVAIVASVEGHDDIVRDVNIAGGQILAVPLFLPDEAPKGGTTTPGNGGDNTSDGGGLSALQIVGIAAMGVGVAGGVVAGVFGAISASKFASLEQACGDAVCAEGQFDDVIDSGKKHELLAYLTGGFSAAALLAGAALLIFGGDSESSEQAAVAPLPGGGMFVYRVSW